MVCLDVLSEKERKQLPTFRKSALALAIMAMSSATVYAQDDDVNVDAPSADDAILEGDILVQGVRSSLQNAQQLKREASTFVDAISASDIGSLPDRSVLEAMQRLPGVSIDRFAAPNDPDHFGVEGSGAVVRGMQATRSEFNGRDSFTANSGRGLSFQDVPPELMSGVDLYKNQSADMIEGGIGGTVSLKTRKPFDADGRQLAFSADLTYTDLIESSTPSYSGIWSDRWDTDSGEWGVLLNFSVSDLEGRSDGIQSEVLNVLRRADENGANQDVNLQYIFAPNDAENFDTSTLAYDEYYIPNGSNMSMKNDYRERNGYAAAVQWEDNDREHLATFQFMRSDATLAWDENTMSYQGSPPDAPRNYPPASVEAAYGEGFIFDGNAFVSGVMSHFDPTGGQRNGDNVRIMRDNYFGHEFQTTTRWKDTNTVVDDYSFNYVWTPDDNWEVSTDIQHIRAKTNDDDVTLYMGNWAVQTFDLRGDVPQLWLHDPYSVYSPTVVEGDVPPVLPYANNPNYFQDTSSYHWRSAMDHYERSEGDSSAFRADVTYTASDEGFFRAVKSGIRFADREQTVRYSQYNWGSLAPIWGQDGADPGFLDAEAYSHGTIDDDGLEITEEVPDIRENTLANDWQLVDWSDFHRGGTVSIPGGPYTIAPSIELTKDYRNWAERLYPVRTTGWEPAEERGLTRMDANGQPLPNVGPGGYFLPGEISQMREKNRAMYVRLDFGSDNDVLPFDGNFGFRYVHIENITSGSITFPDYTPTYPIPEGFSAEDRFNTDLLLQTAAASGIDINPLTNPDASDEIQEYHRWISDANNFLTAEESGFGNGLFVPTASKTSYSTVLPSFNLKLHLNDDMLVRFAVSKAIALPDIGDMKNTTPIGAANGQTTERIRNNPLLPINSSANPFAVDPEPGQVYNPDPRVGDIIYSSQINGWSSRAGNPFLKPMESTQFDLSWEWYFADVGSLTTSLFYKDLNNFFINGAFERNFTNPSGVTQTVNVGGASNGGAGTMEGFEIAYQQTFDMLPEPWNGLGTQLNYTRIEADGVPNSGLSNNASDAAGIDNAADITFGDSIPLEGQSEKTYNIVGFYENDRLSMRLAYNWRSKYLVTARDVIAPNLPIFNEDAGFLDASIFYNLTDSIKVGLQGTNLLDTVTKTTMLVDVDQETGERIDFGRSWFINDRRYSLIVRGTF